MTPVTLIVLNWNGRELLPDCLSALLEVDYPTFHLMVVDNDSTDGSPEYVRRNFPQVTIIENEQNLGFAAGNNVILRNLATEVAVLVNPDVIVDRDWLRALVAGLTSDERIGIAGCKLFYPGRERLQHMGGIIARPRAMPRYVGHNEPDQGQYNELRDVDYVVGAALAIKRDLLNDVGLLDEGFFLYFEDVDLCRRALRAGYRVVCVPDAVAVHGESILAVKESPTYRQHFHTGRWRYILKHYDAEEIMSETGPTEEKWLPKSGSREMVARAYHYTLRHFQTIMAARERDGAGPIDTAQQRRLIGLLERLQQATWNARNLEEIREHWEIREKPFRSNVPLLGPVIAGFRAAWNRVAARDFVRPLVTQQRQVNWLFVEAFEARHEALCDHDKEAATLATDLSSMREAIGDFYQAIGDVEARLDRLEEELLVPVGNGRADES